MYLYSYIQASSSIITSVDPSTWIQTVFNSDMGNKWMVFQGRGAELIDTLESPPVNIAGSIFIKDNGVHYEPILRVDLGV